MGLMTAVRYDENFKAFYACLKANGKHTTQAQIIVMRKIILVTHSLYKNDQQYIKGFGVTHRVHERATKVGVVSVDFVAYLGKVSVCIYCEGGFYCESWVV